MKTGYKVCDIMVRKPIVVSPDATIKEAAGLMMTQDVGSLVVKDTETLIGYITEKEMIHKVIAKGLDINKKTVREIVNKDIRTIGPYVDVYDALKMMADLNVRQLPVVDNGKLVGLLTQNTILKVQPQLFDLVAEKIQLKEDHLRAIFAEHPIEGTCDVCEVSSKKLTQINGHYLCEKCARSMRRH